MAFFLLKADGGKLLKADGGALLLADSPELASATIVVSGSTDDETALVKGAADADQATLEIETLLNGDYRIVPSLEPDSRNRRMIEGFTETERRKVENG